MDKFLKMVEILKIILQDDNAIKFNGTGVEFNVGDLKISTDSEEYFITNGDKITINNINDFYHYVIIRVIREHGIKIYPDDFRICFNSLSYQDQKYIMRKATQWSSSDKVKFFHDISTWKGIPLDVSNELNVSELIVQTIRKANHKKILETILNLTK